MDPIELTVRVMPAGDEVTIELDTYSSGKEIKNALIGQGIAPPSHNDGSPIVYELISKSTSQVIDDHKTLDDVKVRAGETLFIIPVEAAG